MNMKTVKSQESVTYHIGPEVICGDVEIVNKVDSTNRCEALKEVMSLNYV